MSIALDPAVIDAIDDGDLRILPLVRFDLPGKTVGYHIGGRPLSFNGLTYLPSRYLSAESFSDGLGNEITARTLTFSDVPTDNPDDAIAEIESYAYLNAPVTLSWLAGQASTDAVLGILTTQFYEISEVRYIKDALADDGTRTVTVEIDIEPPGRRTRDKTHAKRTQVEQQFDNSATDTFAEYVGVSAKWPVEWGQRTS